MILFHVLSFFSWYWLPWNSTFDSWFYCNALGCYFYKVDIIGWLKFEFVYYLSITSPNQDMLVFLDINFDYKWKEANYMPKQNLKYYHHIISFRSYSPAYWPQHYRDSSSLLLILDGKSLLFFSIPLFFICCCSFCFSFQLNFQWYCLVIIYWLFTFLSKFVCVSVWESQPNGKMKRTDICMDIDLTSYSSIHYSMPISKFIWDHKKSLDGNVGTVKW